MPDQPLNPSLPKPAEEASPSQKQSIRTMKSDVETFFKTTKPSLIQIIGKEAKIPVARPVAGERKIINYRLILFAGIALLAGGFLVFFLISPKSEKSKPKLFPPTPFFATESSRTVSVRSDDRSLFLRLIEDSVREREREGTIKRVLIKLRDGPKERFATVTDFFKFYKIEPPGGFLAYTEQVLMPFVYYGGDGARFGLSFRTSDPDRAMRDLLLWEPSLLRDLAPLFFDETPETVIAPFEDRIYRNIDWRFLKLSQTEDLGITHTVFPAGNVVVIITGKEAMETVINRLFSK